MSTLACSRVDSPASNENPSVLASVLSEADRTRFHANFPDEVFLAEGAGRPPWCADPRMLELAHWSRTYAGPIEVTRGKRAQYPVAGADLSAWVEDLNLAAHLPRLEQHLPGVVPWLRALEVELGLPVGCTGLSAFFNAPMIGLAAHCDPCEHLLIHVRGTKRFRFLAGPPQSYRSVSYCPTVTPSPADALQFEQGFPGWRGQLPETAREVTLVPGSWLFLPRGCYHETQGGAEEVSITFVVQMRIPALAQLWVNTMRDVLMQSPAWRTPVVAKKRRQIEGVLNTELPLPGAEAVLRRARFAGETRPWDRASRFVRNPAVTLSAAAAGGLLVCTGQGQQCIPLSGRAVSMALRWAEHPGPLTYAELRARCTEWDERSFDALVGFLVKHQVLIVLDIL